MNANSNDTAPRAADSSDRTPAYLAARSGLPKTLPGRIGGTTRRLLNALMRSLATPHI